MADPRKASVAAPAGSDESGTFPEQDALFNNLVARSVTVAPSSPYTSAARPGELVAKTIGPRFNILEYASIGPTTDIGPLVNAAVTDANNAGSGTVELPVPPTSAGFQFGTPIVLKPFVEVIASNGTILKWVGATNAFLMANTESAGVSFERPRLAGFTIDANNIAGCVPLFLSSMKFGSVENVQLKNVAGAGIVAFRLECNINGNQCYGNVIRGLTVVGAPVAMQLNGNAGGPVTDNQFFGLHLFSVGTTGMRFVQWCDSNYFQGTNISLSGAGNCIILNDSVTPLADVGVYNETFFGLTCDAFAGPGLGTGATYALNMNWTKQNRIFGLFVSPQGPGTGFTARYLDTAAQSYMIESQGGMAADGGRGAIYAKNWDHVLDAAASISTMSIGSLAPLASTTPTNPGAVRVVGSASTAQAGGVEFEVAQSGSGYGWRVSGADLGGGSVPFLLQARNNSASWTEVMRFDQAGHIDISTLAGAPTTGTLGTNVTSVTFTGNDVRGKIVIVMSGALAANTRIATCTYANNWAGITPIPLLANETSGVGLAVVNFYSGAESATAFDLFSNQALAAGTYTIRYVNIG